MFLLDDNRLGRHRGWARHFGLSRCCLLPRRWHRRRRPRTRQGLRFELRGGHLRQQRRPFSIFSQHRARILRHPFGLVVTIEVIPRRFEVISVTVRTRHDLLLRLRIAPTDEGRKLHEGNLDICALQLLWKAREGCLGATPLHDGQALAHISRHLHALARRIGNLVFQILLENAPGAPDRRRHNQRVPIWGGHRGEGHGDDECLAGCSHEGLSEGSG
mmetsp:Transcript_97227/g.279893  ORF Transcript_97227/g.279893 Transcript_97227/m.279893 type:complete len:217 (-) Transcript_97227:16-666(-)